MTQFPNFQYCFKLTSLFLILFSFILFYSCKQQPKEIRTVVINSPNEEQVFTLELNEINTPTYTLSNDDELIIAPSTFGIFEFKDQPALGNKLEITSFKTKEITDNWSMPWGEQREVVNKYTESTIQLKEMDGLERKYNIIVRLYDDGVGYRYELLPWGDNKEVVIMDERTNFNLTGDHETWWIPGDWDIYEHLYNHTKVSEIDAISKQNHPNLAQTYIPENAVNTPVTMRMDSGTHISFHEANLTNYPGMTLLVNNENYELQSELVGSDRLGHKAKVSLPFKTPWRTIQVGETAGDLIESRLIENLNEPNQLGSMAWFKPMKYVGIWWEMHLGLSTWDMEGTQDMNTFVTVNGKQVSVKHGATTENAKKYIDFAAENGFGGVLIEGWNTGWDHWIGFEDREGVFDFVTPYADYDLDEVTKYAKEKGVEIIMHHETSAAPRTYEQQLDTAYSLMKKHGMHSVKTGYVGKIIPKGEYHHGQWMVNHYRNVLETAAKYDIAINAHEPIKGTGLRRSLPNAISREGLRGQEFNAWSIEGGNPPNHLPTVAFTRMLAGPIDFTPGAFQIKLKKYGKNQINTTLAQQLALYVVIYSPIQMACDLPENYEGKPALQFIRDVGVDWEQSKVLNGEVGEFVTIAREERETGNWFVGGISNEEGRELSISFDFLPTGKSYKATIYKDAEDAHWDKNPTAIDISTETIDHSTVKQITLAPGGGFAISLLEE